MRIYGNREGTILVLTELSIYEERQHTTAVQNRTQKGPRPDGLAEAFRKKEQG